LSSRGMEKPSVRKSADGEINTGAGAAENQLLEARKRGDGGSWGGSENKEG